MFVHRYMGREFGGADDDADVDGTVLAEAEDNDADDDDADDDDDGEGGDDDDGFVSGERRNATVRRSRRDRPAPANERIGVGRSRAWWRWARRCIINNNIINNNKWWRWARQCITIRRRAVTVQAIAIWAIAI